MQINKICSRKNGGTCSCAVTNNFDFVAVIRYDNYYFMIKFIIGMCNVLSLLLSTWTDHKTHINTSK